jgi:SulP family sulfate permease
MGLVTALIGGRPGMISGATGAVAVIFAPLVISQIAKSGVDVAMAHLFLAVCIMGVIQVVFGLLRWGKFVRLIPHSVMLGFVNGLAIIIFKAQLMQFYIIENGVSELLPFLPLMVMIILILITMGISHYLPRITTAIPATLTAIIFVTILGKLIPQFTDINVYTVLDFIQRMDPTKMTVAITLPKFTRFLPQR